jgi:hypothetical protein
MDMAGGEPGLLIALLVNHGQELIYIPGIAVDRATDSCRGAGRPDARDAACTPASPAGAANCN